MENLGRLLQDCYDMQDQSHGVSYGGKNASKQCCVKSSQVKSILFIYHKSQLVSVCTDLLFTHYCQSVQRCYYVHVH